jgi:hypothetical protein
VVGRVVNALVSVVVAMALGAIAVIAHPAQPDAVPIGAQPPASPGLAMADAAARLEAKIANGGPGYTFEILQRSTIHARPGGPLVDIPDPNDRHKSLGLAESLELGSLVERGAGPHRSVPVRADLGFAN